MTLAGSKELPSGGIIDDQSGNVDVQPSGDAHTRPGGGETPTKSFQSTLTMAGDRRNVSRTTLTNAAHHPPTGCRNGVARATAGAQAI